MLTAQVNGGARVPILNLDYSAATVGLSGGQLTFGPVTASLTATAACALNQAFNVTAFTQGLVLGQATITYQLFATWPQEGLHPRGGEPAAPGGAPPAGSASGGV